MDDPRKPRKRNRKQDVSQEPAAKLRKTGDSVPVLEEPPTTLASIDTSKPESQYKSEQDVFQEPAAKLRKTGDSVPVLEEPPTTSLRYIGFHYIGFHRFFEARKPVQERASFGVLAEGE